MDFPTFNVKQPRCRVCGLQPTKMSRLTPDRGQPFEQGFTVCAGCMEVTVVEQGPLGLIFREATTDELIEAQSKYGHLFRMVGQVRAQHPFHPNGPHGRNGNTGWR